MTTRPYRVYDLGGRFSQYARAPLAYARHFRGADVVVDVENGIPFFAPLWTRTPVVCLVHHVHGPQWRMHFNRLVAGLGWTLERRAMPTVYRRAPFIAISPSTAHALERIGVARSSIEVMINGVDLPARCSSNRNGQEPLFVALGRLVSHKRLDLLLRVWEQVRPHTGGRLVIAGGGPELQRLRELAGPGAEVVGPVSEEEKQRLLASAWMLVHPALHEGWGIVVMEAAAHATPTLGFDVPGVRDAIVPDVTGVVVDDEEEPGHPLDQPDRRRRPPGRAGGRRPEAGRGAQLGSYHQPLRDPPARRRGATPPNAWRSDERHATHRPRDEGADVRALGGVAVFWLSALAVGSDDLRGPRALSPHLPAGGLAAVSAVLGLSYVLAVPPGAIQLRAAAAAASPRRELGLKPPRALLATAAALVVASPLLARALEVPTAAAALAGVQLPLAAALGSGRGTLIGRRRLRSAAASLQIDAACRLCAGVALGIAWGASGVALALVLATLVPLLGSARGRLQRALAPDRRSTASPYSEGSTLSYMLAMSAIVLLTNIDVLLAPRVLGRAADSYAVASLPAKGIFFALFAASWLAVSFAINAPTRREVLRPAVATLALGLVGAAAVLAGRPLLPLLFGRGEPPTAVLVPLAIAMACAGTTGVVVAMAVARGARRVWAGPFAASLGLAVVALLFRPDARGLALDVLAAQLVALGCSVWVLLRPPRAVEDGSGRIALAAPTLAEPPGPMIETPKPREESSGRPGEPSPSTPSRAPAEPAFPRRALLLACGLITAACFTQAPGRIVADTKLDLYVNPLRFLSRALQLWDPSAAFGQVQDQAVGYLFPMGPFFAATHGASVPAWVAQRLWMALLLSLAAWGTARLARALRIGNPMAWVLGGLAYALSPFFIGQLASSSVGLLAGALVPWSVLPLVAAARGAVSRRRAAGLSGLAVLAMGGVNAACTIAVLPLPALYILTRRRSRARTSLLCWWALAVGLACFWWAAALVLQGRFGFDFIRFTETGATTQSTTSAFETLRGTGNWVAYLDLGHPWLPAGWSLATAPAAIVATAGVAAAGLAGLALPRLPERRFLVGAFALGVVCVSAGYVGPAAGVAGPHVQALLSAGAGPHCATPTSSSRSLPFLSRSG